MQGEVFPFIKTLHNDSTSAYAKYMDDAIFKIPTPQLLEKIVTALDELYALIDKQPDRKVMKYINHHMTKSKKKKILSEVFCSLTN